MFDQKRLQRARQSKYLDSMEIDFRPLQRDDFGLFAKWLQTPAVRRWWNHDFSPEAIERDFGSCIDGTEPTDVFIAELGDGQRPFGLIQYYLIHDYQEYIDELSAAGIPVPKDAGSIDYLIGEPDCLGRGHGTSMIAAFTDRLWQSEPKLGSLIVPVSLANIGSWKALAAAGFNRHPDVDLEPDNPIDDRAHVLMSMTRPFVE